MNVLLMSTSIHHHSTNKSSAVAEMGDRATIDMGRLEGGCCAPIVGSPSDTMWLGPSSTSIPGDVFIHPAVWPQ